jgi:hypothetical protein
MSPAQSMTRKRKAHPSLNTSLLWTTDPIDNDASTSTQSIGKYPKTSMITGGSVQFDGVMVEKPPLAPCQSTHITKGGLKKDLRELYQRLAQLQIAIAKVYKEIAEANE